MATSTLARTEFAAALSQIASERGITPETVLETIKAAMVAAYRKDHGDQFNVDVEEGWEYDAEIDPVTGGAKILRVKGKKREDVTPPGFGRIAAQTAKQVILQRVREAEKDAIIDEYSKRMGMMISGMVLRFDGTNVIVDIGRGQGFMPPEEQIPTEYYKLNQRIVILIKELRDTMRGRTIVVSRSAPELVKELFAREVPEVNSGAVEIKAIAREPGVRTKIAVSSTQEGVDPVGSCVGQKGIRVQAVISELGGEKIDIIQYSANIKDFITASLAPAEGLQIEINEKKKRALVVVPDDQLSLAIGRGGQNVRLAAKLTGYKIDIKGQSSKTTLSVTGEEEFEIDQLKLSPRVRKLLVNANITSVEMLRRRLESGEKIEGVGPKAQKEIEAVIKDVPQIDRPEAGKEVKAEAPGAEVKPKGVKAEEKPLEETVQQPPTQTPKTQESGRGKTTVETAQPQDNLKSQPTPEASATSSVNETQLKPTDEPKTDE